MDLGISVRERTRGFNGNPDTKVILPLFGGSFQSLSPLPPLQAISIRSVEFRLSAVFRVHNALSESAEPATTSGGYEFMQEMASQDHIAVRGRISWGEGD